MLEVLQARPDQSSTLSAEGAVVLSQQIRVWLSGVIVTESDGPTQGQPFANWACSRLEYYTGATPPPGYTDVRYEPYAGGQLKYD
jgi:hypothetical protein